MLLAAVIAILAYGRSTTTNEFTAQNVNDIKAQLNGMQLEISALRDRINAEDVNLATIKATIGYSQSEIDQNTKAIQLTSSVISDVKATTDRLDEQLKAVTQTLNTVSQLPDRRR